MEAGSVAGRDYFGPLGGAVDDCECSDFLWASGSVGIFDVDRPHAN